MKSFSFSTVAPVMAAIALFVATTASATITVEANRDARMRVSVPSSNFGDFYSLDLVPPGTNTTTALVGFDNLPALTGAEVVSATLELHAWLGTGHTIEARAVVLPLNEDWVEGSGPPGGAGATWNTYDGVNDWPSGDGGGLGDVGALLDSEVVAASNTILTLDVTDAVKFWLDGTANNGFLLNAAPGTSTGNDNRLASREAAAASVLDPSIFGGYVPGGILQPPRLIIEENLLPTATVFTWEADDDGNWANSASWSFSGPASQGVANDPSHTAIFGNAITTNTTAVTNAGVTVNRIEFDSAISYAVAGLGSVNLATDPSGPTAPSVSVTGGGSAGAHQFQTKVSLTDSATVDVASGSTLDFNNEIDLNTNTLDTSSSLGTVNINHSVIGGGAITASAALGTAGSTSIAAALTLSGASILDIDLGNANTDHFNVTGNVVLDALSVVDVTLEPGFVPSGSYTILTASGSLTDGGLTLDASDTGTFSLSVNSNTVVLTALTGLSGDFDGSGAVDGLDFLLWQRGGSPNPLSPTDLADWQANHGAGALAAAGAAAIPEPTSAVLLIVGLAGLTSRRRVCPSP